MIDFRYHVVSLVSVFLALAVGIVLGAGPLNEGISTGITDQVQQLGLPGGGDRDCDLVPGNRDGSADEGAA